MEKECRGSQSLRMSGLFRFSITTTKDKVVTECRNPFVCQVYFDSVTMGQMVGTTMGKSQSLRMSGLFRFKSHNRITKSHAYIRVAIPSYVRSISMVKNRSDQRRGFPCRNPFVCQVYFDSGKLTSQL